MATVTHPDLILEAGEWIDLIADRPALSGLSLSFQVQSASIVQFVAGGAEEPDGTATGWMITQGDEIRIEGQDHVWIKSAVREAKISVNEI